MGKNIVMCFDGTGAQVRAKQDSNVALLYSALNHASPNEQLTYYDPGVGTEAAVGAWTPAARAMSKFFGLAFGVGIRRNLGEAYLWLSNHWNPGDQIFLFGFSRGAYTARALAGMLRTVGLFRPGSENLLSYLLAGYTRRNPSKGWNEDESQREDEFWADPHHLAAVFARPVNAEGRTTPPIAYMGLWDTVKSVGILRWQVHWPYTNLLPEAARVRHAVAIHEWRRPFEYSPVTPEGDKPVLEEVWFTGVHSNIGGGLKDTSLSQISLKWVMDGAIDAGVQMNKNTYEKLSQVTIANARGTLYHMSPLWILLSIARRKVPPGAAVHHSVRDRMLAGGKDIPPLADPHWTDPDWMNPRSM